MMQLPDSEPIRVQALKQKDAEPYWPDSTPGRLAMEDRSGEPGHRGKGQASSAVIVDSSSGALYSRERIEGLFVTHLKPLFEYTFSLEPANIAALEIFVSRLPSDLSVDERAYLQSVLEDQVVSDVSVELIGVIESMYALRQAEEALYERLGPPQTMEHMLEFHQQLSALRTSMLNDRLAEALYGGAVDATNELNQLPDPEDDPLGHAIERLTQDGLSAEEVAQALEDEFGSDAADNYLKLRSIEDQWLERYQVYLREKRFIVDAGLDPQEKQEQILALLRKHYSPEEYEAARRYDEAVSSAE